MRLNMGLLEQPKTFWIVAFGELWNTFSYFGTQTILVLYFLHVFKLSQSDSYQIYGAYAALAYSLPILGGIVADRFLGSKHTIIIGSCLNSLGNFLLLSSQHYLFCLGLTTSLVGMGLYKSNGIHLVGTLYQNASRAKERGFTLLYLCINVGGVLGPLIYGLIVYAAGWRFGFLCSALGILVSAIWFFYNRSVWTEDNKQQLLKTPGKIFIYVIIASSCLFFSLPFYKPVFINALIFTLFTASILYLLGTIIKYQNQERRRLVVLLLISFFGMFYFAVGLQIGTTITLFIQDKIQQGFIKTHLPASTFSTFYPLFVLLLAPFFSHLWDTLKARGLSLSAPGKLAIGMALATGGIGVFAVAALTNWVWMGIIVGNLMLSAGELALMPAIYTAISDLSPLGMKSTMMGGWLLFVALGGYLSGLLARAAHFAGEVFPFQQTAYFGQFLFIACFTFLIVLILTASIPKLTKMMD